MTSLSIRSGVVITMNDRFDIIEGDVSINEGRMVDGELLVDDFTRLHVDRRALAAEAREAARPLVARATVGVGSV